MILNHRSPASREKNPVFLARKASYSTVSAARQGFGGRGAGGCDGRRNRGRVGRTVGQTYPNRWGRRGGEVGRAPAWLPPCCGRGPNARTDGGMRRESRTTRKERNRMKLLRVTETGERNRVPVVETPAHAGCVAERERLSPSTLGALVPAQAVPLVTNTNAHDAAANGATTFRTLLKTTLGVASAQGVAYTLIHFYGCDGTGTDFRACLICLCSLALLFSVCALLFLPLATLFVGVPLGIKTRQLRWLGYTLLLAGFQVGLAVFQTMQVGALIAD